MDKLSAFVVAMVTLSVGVERTVEIFKGFSKWLRESDSHFRPPVIQILAALSGGLTAFFVGPHHFVDILPSAETDQLAKVGLSALLGLMASGGSAFWNHALDIVGAVKTVKEKAAEK